MSKSNLWINECARDEGGEVFAWRFDKFITSRDIGTGEGTVSMCPKILQALKNVPQYVKISSLEFGKGAFQLFYPQMLSISVIRKIRAI